MNRVRKLVSKKKTRYIDKDSGFNLDLTYIGDRIVSMGFPSEGVEGKYRNPMPEVQRFFEERHKDHYRIYNLCSERSYDADKFHGRVEVFPFDDHHPPPIELMHKFAMSAVEWMEADDENVVVVHCKAGKGRTGTMIACLLMAMGQCPTADEALDFFAQERTANGKGVTIPSQIRYVHYYEHIYKAEIDAAYKNPCKHPLCKPRKLERIVMKTIPDFDRGGGCDPYVVVKTLAGEQLFKSEPLLKLHKKTTNEAVIEVGGLEVCGDLKVSMIDWDKVGSDDKMCHFCFHTCFIRDNRLHMVKNEIDKAVKDKKAKLFHEDFALTVEFSPVPGHESDAEDDEAEMEKAFEDWDISPVAHSF